MFIYFLVFVHQLSLFFCSHVVSLVLPLLFKQFGSLSLSNLLSFSQCFYRSFPSDFFLSFSSIFGFDLTQRRIYIHYITLHYTTLHYIALRCIHTCTHTWMNGSTSRYMHTYRHIYIFNMNTITDKQGMHMNIQKHRHTNTQAQEHSGKYSSKTLGNVPKCLGQSSPKTLGNVPEIWGQNF